MSGQAMEIVIGLEVHAELDTASKIFCACATTFGAPPNTQICPVCLGLPGSLPVLNYQALVLALRAALALGADITPATKFDRKHYFYPDLPKAYQISQYDRPLATGGFVVIDTPDGEKRIRLTRLHMEEDAGKLLHLGEGGRLGQSSGSLVDYNRAGVPLIEIVSEPDLRSPEDAYAYLAALKQMLLYSEVSDCNMEEGSLRCDANISVRPRGQQTLGTKIEIKNMNSFKSVRAALESEAARQVRVLTEGGRLTQETRLWDEGRGATVSMRGKEEAHDYRYFPEPDLPLVSLSPDLLDVLRHSLPEPPRARHARFQRQYGLTAYDAGVLTATRALADYFEAAAALPVGPKTLSNWITVELLGRLNAEGRAITDSPVSPEALAGLVRLLENGTLSGKMAKQVFVEMTIGGESAETVVARLGLSQISDSETLERMVNDVLEAHPGPVADYRAGKSQSLGFLVGQVMKASRGQANPQLVNQLLQQRLQADA